MKLSDPVQIVLVSYDSNPPSNWITTVKDKSEQREASLIKNGDLKLKLGFELPWNHYLE